MTITEPVTRPLRATAPAARARGRRLRSPRNAVLGVLGLLAFAALLQVLPGTGLVDPRFLPTTTEIVAALVERIQTGRFWVALGQTLTTWLLGLAIATASAIVLGAVIGSVPFLRRATASTVEFLRPIPSVAFISVVVLLYGTGMMATLVLVVYATFWQVYVQVVRGVMDVDPVARDTARSFRFGRSRVLRSVVWPSALPFVLTGFRLGASIAIILTVTGELIIGTPGIGNLIATAQNSGAVASMYALVVVTGLLGVAVNALTRVVEAALLHWHPSVRRTTA